jgi:predicted nucleic acid-binding protein
VYVADTSVVARWHLNNPPHVESSLAVRDDYIAGRVNLIGPDNLAVEVVGAIRQAVNARYISATVGERHVEQFWHWNIALLDTKPLILPAYRLSIRLGCSFYDAIYLVLAESRNLPFIHADRNLKNALNGRFPQEQWIEDYRSG